MNGQKVLLGGKIVRKGRQEENFREQREKLFERDSAAKKTPLPSPAPEMPGI